METPQESEQTSVEVASPFEDPDFSALTGFADDDVEETAEETPAETPPVAAEAEEEAVEHEHILAPEETPPAPEESEGAETAEVEETEQVAEEEVPAPEPVKLPTREEIQGLYTEHREKTLPLLEEQFTLTEEEAAALDERPSEVLPKMAARLQYDVMLSTYNAVMTAMPSVMGTLMHTNDLATKAHGQFMEAWPELNNPKAEGAVKAAIQAYRSANPRADLKTTIQNAGVMASIQLGLDPTPGKKQEKPAAKKPAPPRPAAPTGSNPVPPAVPQGEENVFAELASVFSETQR